ncbi:MAG: AAA family ATPase [Leptospiraceae bacterium]|nr:AAA family ATPase [Leptospiraceae bacterium]
MSSSNSSKSENAERELEQVREALRREHAAEQERFQQEWLALPLDRRRQLGVTLHPVHVQSVRMIVGERWKLTCSYTPTEHRHLFQHGQPIEFFREAEERLSAVLAWIGESEFEAVVDQLPDWLESGRPGINRTFDEKVYREMDAALERVSHAPHALAEQRDCLLGYASMHPLSTLSPAADSDARQFIKKFKLNSAQVEAVLGVLRSSDFTIIHGPPGTGKTRSLVAAIALMVHTGDRVLVTAPTNTAVDLLAELLAPYGFAMLRIGHPGRVDENALAYTLDGRLAAHSEASVLNHMRRDAEELYRKAHRYRRNFGSEERAERQACRAEYRDLMRQVRTLEKSMITQIIDDAVIVLSTLTGANHPLIAEQHFDVAVIDEAAQALEPAAWIPIQRAPRTVLAGDHCQLPPTIISAEKNLAHTLFEKVIERHSDAHPDRIFFLDEQYRMHPDIMAFSNSYFYEDRLRAADAVGERDAFDFTPFERSLVFINTAGADCVEEADPESESMRNPGEAQLLLQIYKSFVPRLKQCGHSAGLIAPYRAQITLLRKLLRTEGLYPDDVLVDTVDSFQGGERDWIAISLTRSNDEGEIGFLGEIRRLNVAMTRARRMLIMLGDSATLSYDPFFRRLLEHCDRYGDYRSAYEFME